MQNDEEIPPNQPNDLDPRHLAARMRGLELRVLALEAQLAGQTEAAHQFSEHLARLQQEWRENPLYPATKPKS
jgi:hypothetical protein